MCTTCGCSEGAEPRVSGVDDGDEHHHHHHHHEGHDHHHHHAHGGHGDHHHDHDFAVEREPRVIRLEEDLLARNDLLAERNRGWLDGRGVAAYNLVGSPGAGKTTLLERTIADLQGDVDISVIEGDQATLHDARRIREAGARAVQVNTGTGCHLDADMVRRGLEHLDPAAGSLLVIENVGNLVCPALFDLGERAKVTLVSVTEGDDKPLKYPHMFRASELLVVTKTDLLPHVAFDVGRCVELARQVNPRIEVLELSATTGNGLSAWYAWIRQRLGPGAPREVSA